MFEYYEFDLSTVGTAGPLSKQMPGSMPSIDRRMIPVNEADSASAEFIASNGAATDAVIELKKNYTGVAGRGVGFSTAATMDASTVRRVALDVQDAPFLEVIINTAGAAGEVGRLYIHAYRTA